MNGVLAELLPGGIQLLVESISLDLSEEESNLPSCS